MLIAAGPHKDLVLGRDGHGPRQETHEVVQFPFREGFGQVEAALSAAVLGDGGKEIFEIGRSHHLEHLGDIFGGMRQVSHDCNPFSNSR